MILPFNSFTMCLYKPRSHMCFPAMQYFRSKLSAAWQTLRTRNVFFFSSVFLLGLCLRSRTALSFISRFSSCIQRLALFIHTSCNFDLICNLESVRGNLDSVLTIVQILSRCFLYNRRGHKAALQSLGPQDQKQPTEQVQGNCGNDKLFRKTRRNLQRIQQGPPSVLN